MIKGSKINLDIYPPRLYEDIYLCTEYGRIVSAREWQKRHISNIFEIFSPTEKQFILKNMKFSTRPLLFAISELGPVFIDVTAVNHYGQLAVIVPLAEPDESLDLAFGALRTEVLPSEKAEKLHEIFKSHEALDSTDFCVRMVGVYSGVYDFDFSSHTDEEVVEFLSRKVQNYGVLFGCDVSFSVKQLCTSGAENRIEKSALLFILPQFLMIARENSSKRDARVDAFFDGSGLYFDFGFKIVSDKRGLVLSRENEEIAHLCSVSDSKKLACICYQNEDSFVLRAFPWVDYPVGNETKKPEPDFDY